MIKAGSWLVVVIVHVGVGVVHRSEELAIIGFVVDTFVDRRGHMVWGNWESWRLLICWVAWADVVEGAV